LQEIAKKNESKLQEIVVGHMCQFSLASLTNLLFLELAHNLCQTLYLGKYKRPRNGIFFTPVILHYDAS